MGRRPQSARFMPGVLVFPGGALEPQDEVCSGFPEAFATPPRGIDRASRRLFPALVRCALRELHEETGLLVTAVDSGPSAAPGPTWQSYAAAGASPDFGALRLVFRAVTPASSPIRFDTRFFFASEATTLGALKGSGELEDLEWLPLAALDALPLRQVTRQALGEAVESGAEGGPARPLRTLR